ncbi:hypothetical protein STREPTOSP366_37860 [Streptomyces variabilis]
MTPAAPSHEAPWQRGATTYEVPEWVAASGSPGAVPRRGARSNASATPAASTTYAEVSTRSSLTGLPCDQRDVAGGSGATGGGCAGAGTAGATTAALPFHSAWARSHSASSRSSGSPAVRHGSRTACRGGSALPLTYRPQVDLLYAVVFASAAKLRPVRALSARSSVVSRV